MTLVLNMGMADHKLISLLTLALLLSACASEGKRGRPKGQEKIPVEEESFDQDDSQESTQQEELHPVEEHDNGSMMESQTTSPSSFTEILNSSVAADGNGTDELVPTERSITKIHNPLFPITDSSYSAYGILFLAFVVFAFGVVGNLAVMCIVWQNYFMRSAWNYFLASLAFWDFLVLCFCLPVVVFNELTNKRLLGDFSCRVVPYIEVRPSKSVMFTWTNVPLHLFSIY